MEESSFRLIANRVIDIPDDPVGSPADSVF